MLQLTVGYLTSCYVWNVRFFICAAENVNVSLVPPATPAEEVTGPV